MSVSGVRERRAEVDLGTNGICLKDGLLQLEMCIPSRGKEGGEEQTASSQVGRLTFNTDPLTRKKLKTVADS